MSSDQAFTESGSARADDPVRRRGAEVDADAGGEPHHGFSRRPTTNQPLNAQPRPRWTPLVAVAALIVAILLLITWQRYNS